MPHLNPQQQKAVETTIGPVLIIAGAGAGKTRVITHRILNIIKGGVAPHHVLAITFTNKAAKEMRERVERLLTEDRTLNIPISINERPFVSTFHALGVHIIRENARLLGLTRHFTIYDRSDSRRAIKEAMEKASIDPKKFDPGMILNKISLAKGDATDRLAFMDRAKGYFDEMVADIWERYETILAKEKALDFDDLLLRAAQLMENHPDIRKHYGSIWKYIHIDEYQDTNRIQYKIVNYLTDGQTAAGQASRNICVVGDADQNIYSWRGATIENILNFEKDYPETAIIILEENYRSTKTILEAANMIIEKNLMRKKKTLYTENEAGEKISLLVSYSEIEEARAIADISRDLIGGGTLPMEIAVLYRANFQSRALEEAFIKKNIPYQLIGVRFFERKEVKDVLSYIRAALNRESLGDISRIVNVPPRGIGKVTVAKVLAGQENTLPSGMRLKIHGFWKLLDDIKSEIMEKKPSEVVKFVIQETGIEKMLHPLAGGDSEDEDRLLNIRELVSVATQYDHIGPETVPPGTGSVMEIRIPHGIEKFLENAALATDQDDLEKNKDAVKLMTVHASKGLEFDTVVIAGLEQNLFPFKHINEDGMDKRQEEEERRLFYVALTRAKKKVYLSYSIIRTMYGSQRVNAPSEFIADIEKSLIDDSPSGNPPPAVGGAKAIFIDF